MRGLKKKEIYKPAKGEVLQFLRSHNVNYRETGGENIAIDCPYCYADCGQHYTAYINTNTGLWQCWRKDNCGQQGTYRQLQYKITGGKKEMAEDKGATATGTQGISVANMQDVQTTQAVGIGTNKDRVQVYKLADIADMQLSDTGRQYLHGRGIVDAVIDRYHIVSDNAQPDKYIILPFVCDDGETVLFAKARSIQTQGYIDNNGDLVAPEKKELSISGKPILYGLDQLDDTGNCNTLIITEGEMDTLAIASALHIVGQEEKYDVVSVPMGCSNFGFLDKSATELLNSYERVIIWGDKDDTTGTITLVDKFNVIIDVGVDVQVIADYMGTKDANDYLRAYGAQAVVDALDCAKTYTDSEIISIMDVDTSDNDDKFLFPTGFADLDGKINGVERGTLTLLVGCEGSGKSTLLQQMLVQAAQHGVKSLLYSGEMSDKDIVTTLQLQAAGKQYVQRQINPKTGIAYGRIIDPTAERKIKEWLSGYIKIYREQVDYSSINDVINKRQDPTELMHRLCVVIENQIKRHGVQYVVLDNMMSILADVEEGSAEYQAQSELVRRLNYIAKKYDVAIWLAVHPRKTQGAIQLHLTSDDVKGTSTVKNVCDCLLAYEQYRPSKDEKAKIDSAKEISDPKQRQQALADCSTPSGHIRILKNRRWGVKTAYDDDGIACWYGGVTHRVMSTSEKDAASKGNYIKYNWVLQP